MEEQLYYEGIITHIIYQNEENGYSVVKIEIDKEQEITATGTMPRVSVGEQILVYGSFKTNKTYGEQFIVEAYEINLPSSERGITEYLSSKAIKGVGKKLAVKIVDAFKEDTFDIIANHHEKLTQVEGITLKKAQDINEKFLKQTKLRFILEFLLKYKLPLELASKVYKTLGEDAQNIIEENPYILCDEYFDIDFFLIDDIAKSLLIHPLFDERIKAFIIHLLKVNLKSGHAFIPFNKLTLMTSQHLEVEIEVCCEAVNTLILESKLYKEQILNLEAVYLSDIYSAECYICDYLKMLANHKYDYDFDIDILIDELQKDLNITYEKIQIEAIKQAGLCGVTILTGGPGTGKTTTVSGILSLFDALGLNTILCAPTGKAAKRLFELTGREASTIHRMLEASFSIAENKMIFMKNIENPLDIDALIIDESSMIDVSLIRAILRAVKFGTRIVFVGDPDQLPPVGAGNFLKDVINSKIFNVIKLSEIFRQAKESMIVLNAHGVNQGKVPKSSDKNGDFFIIHKTSNAEILNEIASLTKTRLPNFYKFKPAQIQVLCPSKNGPSGTIAINRKLQEELNPLDDTKTEKRFGDKIFRTFDRVIQVKNNYDVLWTKDNVQGSGIFNGEVGEIVEIDLIEQLLVINFDEKIAIYTFDMVLELELAYALTVHKAQGSEFDAVILAATSSYQKLLTRNILYTAITRAKKLMIIVSNGKTLTDMTANNTINKRYSGLKVRLVRG